LKDKKKLHASRLLKLRLQDKKKSRRKEKESGKLS